MKHVSGILQKVTAVVAVVAALSSCNRAEYAALPQTSSYHGTQYVAAKPTQVPVAPAAVEATAPTPAAIEAPVAPETAVATAPVAAKAAPAVAATTAPRKLNLAQRLVVNKVAKKAGKLASKMQLKQHSETAKTTAIEGKLRQGLLLLLAGVVLSLLAGLVNIGFIYVIGGIVALVGLIFILLYLLDAV